MKSLSHVRLFATPWTAAYQSPPVHGIFQARVLEWVAIAFSIRKLRLAQTFLWGLHKFKNLPGRQFPQVNPRWLCIHTTVLKSCPWCWPFLPKVLWIKWPDGQSSIHRFNPQSLTSALSLNLLPKWWRLSIISTRSASVYGVAQSRTRLKRLSSSSSTDLGFVWHHYQPNKSLYQLIWHSSHFLPISLKMLPSQREMERP